MGDFFEMVSDLMVPIFLAAFGGLARAFRFGFHGWQQFSGGIIISAFTGVVIHLAIQDIVALSEAQKAAIVAASGYSGGAVLDSFVAMIARRLDHLHHKK